MSAPHFKQLLWPIAVVVATAASGCVATTTATVESTVHAPDSFRFQSCDATARVQVVLTRN